MDKLINYLKEEVQRLIEYDSDFDTKGWYYEEGILITGNEAKTIIEHKHTDTDMQEFAEWTCIHEWFFVQEANSWGSYADEFMGKYKTTSQLRKQWEIETGRRPKP